MLQLNEKLLTINTTQVLHGVELSSDQTGVKATFSASNYTVSVHFDGSTALVHLRGRDKAPGARLHLSNCKMSSDVCVCSGQCVEPRFDSLDGSIRVFLALCCK